MIRALLATLALLLLAQAAAAQSPAFRSEIISVSARGPADAPSLIFVPGLASTPAIWSREANRLDGRYRVHLVSIRGFGTLAAGTQADGALTGPNLDLLAEIVRRRPDLKLQASGGVATLDDIHACRDLGCDGAIVGRALYEGRFTLEEALEAAA